MGCSTGSRIQFISPRKTLRNDQDNRSLNQFAGRVLPTSILIHDSHRNIGFLGRKKYTEKPHSPILELPLIQQTPTSRNRINNSALRLFERVLLVLKSQDFSNNCLLGNPQLLVATVIRDGHIVTHYEKLPWFQKPRPFPGSRTMAWPDPV